MDLIELYNAIQAGKYVNAEHIYCEDGSYFVSPAILLETPRRGWVDTVGGFRTRWNIPWNGYTCMETGYDADDLE